MNAFQPQRRRFLSAAAVTLLAGGIGIPKAHAHTSTAQASDVDILNVALGLEHEAIAIYQWAQDSGLLTAGVADVAALFQGHHKGHRDALARGIGKLGGTAVDARPMQAYVDKVNLTALADQAAVLALATRLEREAADAYLSVIPQFRDARLQQFAGRLAADETMHWTALVQATGGALPQAPLTFCGECG